jgi:hypothetical protein
LKKHSNKKSKIMETKESDFFIDKMILKYQSLSKKEKSIINLCLGGFLVILIIGKVYDGGKVFGEFLYNINN